MNYRTNVFANTKLAKLHLAQARQDIDRKNFDHACKNIVHAIECVMASVNNISSIVVFNKQVKKARRPRFDTPKSMAKKMATAAAVVDSLTRTFGVEEK